jgi:hypothetical protein
MYLGNLVKIVSVIGVELGFYRSLTHGQLTSDNWALQNKLFQT